MIEGCSSQCVVSHIGRPEDTQIHLLLLVDVSMTLSHQVFLVQVFVGRCVSDDPETLCSWLAIAHWPG